MAKTCIHSIRLKGSALVVLIVVLVTCVGTVNSLRETRRVIYRKELARLHDWSRFLARDHADEMARLDRSLLREASDQLLTDRCVYVSFLTAAGEPLAAGERVAGMLARVTQPDGRMTLDPLNRPTLQELKPYQLSYVDICIPVHLPSSDKLQPESGALCGYLRLGVDVSDTRQSLAFIARQYMLTGAMLLLLLVPLSLVLAQRVLAPIRELARAAHAIASGSMDARAEVDSRDEIGELAGSFNRMAQRVTETQLELIKLNVELEERVQQRTQELAELASRDPLTGLYNRRHFGEVITREFASAERYGDDMTCLMFDVDHFKAINDTYGHRTGDAVLMALAMAIGSELRGSDVAARFGGDEFVLLLPQTSATAASHLADRIQHSFENEVHRTYPGITPTLSIGAASLRTTRARSSESLIHEADLALYAAKEAGRNRLMEASAVVA